MSEMKELVLNEKLESTRRKHGVPCFLSMEQNPDVIKGSLDYINNSIKINFNYKIKMNYKRKISWEKTHATHTDSVHFLIHQDIYDSPRKILIANRKMGRRYSKFNSQSKRMQIRTTDLSCTTEIYQTDGDFQVW